MLRWRCVGRNRSPHSPGRVTDGTDTVGAVTGALAGARFGADRLPERWLEQLDYRADLTLLAGALATTDIQA